MARGRRMFVGCEAGIFLYDDDGGAWREAGSTLPGKRTSVLRAAPDGTVYVGVPDDGVYVSADGGSTWDRSFSGDVRSLALDPADPGTVYAGTEPIKLFRTTDAGDHWAELEGLQNMPEAVREKWWFPVYPHEGHVLSIAVDETDPRILYLGLEHGGIVRSDDAGMTWEDSSSGIEYLDIHMVQSDPRRQNIVYAATARAFYRSEDYGRDWVFSHTGLNRDYMHDFVLRPGDQATLYMTTANGTPPAWMRPEKAQAAIFRSTDSGLSWRQLGGGMPESMDRMVWAVSGDPADDAVLYAGFGDYAPNLPPGTPVAGEIWATPNRGDTWSKMCNVPSAIRSICVTAS